MNRKSFTPLLFHFCIVFHQYIDHNLFNQPLVDEALFCFHFFTIKEYYKTLFVCIFAYLYEKIDLRIHSLCKRWPARPRATGAQTKDFIILGTESSVSTSTFVSVPLTHILRGDADGPRETPVHTQGCITEEEA